MNAINANTNEIIYGIHEPYNKDEILRVIELERKAKGIENFSKNKARHLKETKRKSKIILFFKIVAILILLAYSSIFLFFNTTLFQKYKELWVETAMSTMNHQYLATWFLSDEEIDKILKSLEVENNENSDSNNIVITEPQIVEEQQPVIAKNMEITVDKISGKNYVGFVMVIPDASKVKLVDSRKKNIGTKLSEIAQNNNAIAAINAGGFLDTDGSGKGNILADATIIDGELIYGEPNTKYSLIGLTKDKKLMLGKYTYEEAMQAGIESAIEFGPFLIVNGNNQITNSNSGGIHPRMAIGQKQDGTFVFVCIDGRQPGYSLGTNLLELQNIFNRYDVYNAANLDGGSSATMYYEDKVINKTSTPIGERYLPNAFIVEK